MTNKKHSEFSERNGKWKDASNTIIDIRYKLDDTLRSFTDEEKQSVRYKQLLETMSQQFDHLLGDYNKKKEEETRQKFENEIKLEKALHSSTKKKNGWLSYKSAIIAAVGAIIVKIVSIIPALITAISSLFGGP
jgi:hypothetical protein